MTSQLAAPPSPPGSLINPPAAAEVMAFLDALRVWKDQLRASLASLDRRAQVATKPDSFTADLTLALSLWESIDRRNTELVAAWDSGRVLVKELAHVAQLLWGRLPDALGNPTAFSLGEATTLAAALEARLDARLDADTIAGSGAADRIGPLRETLVRCRKLAETLGRRGGEADQLAGRLESALASTDGPAAVGARVDAVADAAELLERDLIKETSLRAAVQAAAADVAARVAALGAVQAQVQASADRCRDKIVGPPRIAVPDASVLGPVPSIPSGPEEPGAWTAAAGRLAAYRARVDQVAAALAEAGRRFEAPLAERAELRGLLEAYRAKAGGAGLAEDPGLGELFEPARRVLWQAPCYLAGARPLVAAYERAVQMAVDGRRDHAESPVGAQPPVSDDHQEAS